MRQQLALQQVQMRQQQERLLGQQLVLEQEQVPLLSYRKQRGQQQQSKLPKRVICS
jgi:cyanate lyase